MVIGNEDCQSIIIEGHHLPFHRRRVGPKEREILEVRIEE